jgi:hypothetical protein
LTSADDGGEVEEQAHDELEAVKNDIVALVDVQYVYLSVSLLGGVRTEQSAMLDAF